PTRQLVWDRLDLERSPWAAPAQVDAGSWVDAARDLDEALWVNGRGESERFVFYEAATTERVPLAFFRGRNGLHLRNDGPHAVHDVFVVNRAPRGLGDVVTVVFVADLAAGDAAPIDLGGPALSPADAAAATVGRLRGRLVNPLFPDARAIFEAPSAGPCAMGRDPALPTEQAAGFQLFAGEADLLLSVWEKRFFGASGVTVVYREDPAALDAAMPLSVYTDMRHVPVVHRAGLAVWEHVRLP
ncbi:MAG: hypothetical protein KC635_18675, partial [Myxococcales bacterium]|nr:hypothetical protein [Myxococcales bacterium]